MDAAVVVSNVRPLEHDGYVLSEKWMIDSICEHRVLAFKGYFVY